MANFNLTITNEGAAFLADVIVNQGTINFSEVRFSSTNYVGSEAGLTAGTFGGTFITAVPSASVMDGTTINVAASFTNATFTADESLYSIGVIADDGNGTDYLIAVATTSTPDILSKLVLSVSTYAYNINLGVSSTDNITVTASTAGVVYVADIVDNLTSENTNKPLSAKQGKTLKDLIDQHGGGLLPHIVVNTDSGSVVTLTKDGDTITATETSTDLYEADVTDYGTWTITAIKGADTVIDSVDVDTVKIYEIAIAFFSATITVNYPNDLRGETFTCISGGTTLTETAPADANSFSFNIPFAGTWTVTGAYSKDVVVSASEVYTTNFVALKTFATATDAEIAGMVSEADAGNIDLYDDCGWRVGQEHSVELSAISSSGEYDGVSWSVGESQTAQTATLVLMHKGLYELVTPVLDKQGQSRSTCSFIVGLKGYLDTTGYMNSTATNAGSWEACARRNWCNGGFRQAISSTIRGCFKQFKCITGTFNGTAAGGENIITNDYFALAAPKEVFGIKNISTQNEADALTQFEWYETSANRIKGGWTWWERSPGYENAAYFGMVNNSGGGDRINASNLYHPSPFGCL